MNYQKELKELRKRAQLLVNFLNYQHEDERITPLLLVWQVTQMGDLASEIVQEMWKEHKQDEQVEAYRIKLLEEGFHKAISEIQKSLDKANFDGIMEEAQN